MGISFVDPPDSTPLANIYNRLRALRAAIDAYLAGTAWATPTANVNVNVNFLEGTRWRKAGGMITVNIEMQATASLIANETLFTLPAAARPTRPQRVLLAGGGGPFFSWATLGTDGTLKCPLAITNGTQLLSNVTYPAAS